MANCLLNRDLWRKFAQGNLSGEERRRLIEHLGGECDDCDDFILELDPQELNSALCIKVGEKKAGENEAGELDDWIRKRFDAYLSEQDEVYGNVMAQSRRRGILPPLRSNWMPAFAAAAIVLLVAVVAFQNNWITLGWKGIKGEKLSAPSIILQVAVLKHKDQRLKRGMQGEICEENDILFFRYELKNPGYVYIIRVNGSSSEIIYPPDPSNPEVQQEGVYGFREGGDAAGFHLSGLKGRQTFFAVAASRPINLKKEIKPMLESYLKDREHSSAEFWSLDSFEINVTRGGE